jgi:hypothetical protein
LRLYIFKFVAQYLGDANWQFIWKTSGTYARQCRTMLLTLRDKAHI